MADTGGVAAGQLRSFIERIERLEEEKKGLSDDIRDVFAEAKGNGFDTKVMRQVIRLRKKEPAERHGGGGDSSPYMHALGMAPAPPPRAARNSPAGRERPRAAAVDPTGRAGESAR